MATPRIMNALDNQDQRDKMLAIVAELGDISSQTDAITADMNEKISMDPAWDMLSGIDAYTLVDVLGSILARILLIEAEA